MEKEYIEYMANELAKKLKNAPEKVPPSVIDEIKEDLWDMRDRMYTWSYYETTAYADGAEDILEDALTVEQIFGSDDVYNSLSKDKKHLFYKAFVDSFFWGEADGDQ